MEHYLLVGVTEELGDFILLLEATLPKFYKGATYLYSTGKSMSIEKVERIFFYAEQKPKVVLKDGRQRCTISVLASPRRDESTQR